MRYLIAYADHRGIPEPRGARGDRRAGLPRPRPAPRASAAGATMTFTALRALVAARTGVPHLETDLFRHLLVAGLDVETTARLAEILRRWSAA